MGVPHYHLTSRCHNRTFLLKAATWRNDYRRRLREALALFDVWLLGCCITEKLRGRAKPKLTEIGTGEWMVADCEATDPLGGATLLVDAGSRGTSTR